MEKKRPLSTEAMQAILDGSPFIKFCQMKVTEIDAERQTLTMVMPFRPELERRDNTNQYHGGCIASLIDVAGNFALVTHLGASVPTISLRVDYLRPAEGAKLIAKAVVRRAGQSIGVVDIDILDDRGRLAAVGRGCYSMASW